jgi:hypothetical protein
VGWGPALVCILTQDRSSPVCARSRAKGSRPPAEFAGWTRRLGQPAPHRQVIVTRRGSARLSSHPSRLGGTEPAQAGCIAHRMSTSGGGSLGTRWRPANASPACPSRAPVPWRGRAALGPGSPPLAVAVSRTEPACRRAPASRIECSLGGASTVRGRAAQEALTPRYHRERAAERNSTHAPLKRTGHDPLCRYVISGCIRCVYSSTRWALLRRQSSHRQ